MKSWVSTSSSWERASKTTNTMHKLFSNHTRLKHCKFKTRSIAWQSFWSKLSTGPLRWMKSGVGSPTNRRFMASHLVWKKTSSYVSRSFSTALIGAFRSRTMTVVLAYRSISETPRSMIALLSPLYTSLVQFRLFWRMCHKLCWASFVLTLFTEPRVILSIKTGNQYMHMSPEQRSFRIPGGKLEYLLAYML